MKPAFSASFVIRGRAVLFAIATVFVVGTAVPCLFAADVPASAPALAPEGATKPAPAAPAASPAPAPQSGQISVGIAQVKVAAPVRTATDAAGIGHVVESFTKALEVQLAAQLAAARKFKVVTRADLDTVFKEQELAASGAVDTSDAATARRYKIAGTSTVLQVTVTDFQDRVRTFRSVELDQEITRRDIRVLVSASLLDTTTGVVRESLTIAPVTQESLDRRILAVRSATAAGGELVTALSTEVSKRVSERLFDALFPAKILSRNGDVVLVNRGDGTGIAVGSEWNIFAPGAALIDPDTGENLGADESIVGRVVITEVLPKFARAKITQDKGIAKGQIARAVPSSAQAPKTNAN